MKLPVMPPVRPMLAKAMEEVPVADGLLYEPKWDGYRTIVFRDGDEVELGSRNQRPLTRYFPELLSPIREQLPERVVIDGEIVVAGDRGLDFDLLSQRIHPAASRVNMLAETTPAQLVVFDLLALDDRSFMDEPLRVRRAELERLLGGVTAPIHLTPATTDAAKARDWFDRFEGAGLDGVVAKPLDMGYLPDKRAQFKVKHRRTADCVVAGFRVHKDGEGIGSFLLGLYDDASVLHHVGVASSFTAKMRRELWKDIEPYRGVAIGEHPWGAWADAMAHETQRMPGAPSRWSGQRSLDWEPLRPELVCEVEYGQLEKDRFRHPSHFLRWRPDRDPTTCTYEQLNVIVPEELEAVFGA